MYDFHYNYIKENMFIKLNYCLQTLIVYCMKLKQMCMKIFIWRKICLILVNIQVTQDFMMWKKKKLIDKVKGETKRVTIVEFVGLKSKIYSYIKKDNEED